MQTSSPSDNDDRGRVLHFRQRPQMHWRVGDDGPPAKDYAPWPRRDDAEDYRHRMRMNAVTVIVLAVLICCGVWIMNTLVHMRQDQDCVLSGRRDCAPIEVPDRAEP